MTVPENFDQWVWLARVRRPQGRKGEVIADILTDFSEKFSERKRLWLLSEGMPLGQSRHTGPAAPRDVELVDHWLHKGGVVLHFAGVDSISAAEGLTGLIVAIPREDRAGLGEDEVYIGDLIGCTLVDVANRKPGETAAAVGQITDVDRGAGPVPLLVLDGPSGEVLIPFAKSYLRRLDLAAKRVEMELPEGLIELNEPGR